MLPRETLYLRFVTADRNDESRSLQGIFQAVTDLFEHQDLAEHERLLLRQTFDWFNDNLRVPPYSRGGAFRKGIAWFHPEASLFIRRMWTFVAVLRARDVPVYFIQTRTPGRIIYRDDDQIVARPKRALRVRHVGRIC